jgi:D-alanine-D-alanine ligase
LKGFKIGGAQVSEKHANFIINAGGATADDIEKMIAHVQAQVAQKHGILLQTEVCIVGEKLDNRTAQDFGTVAVLMGGNSAEREVSLKSGAAVHAALLRMALKRLR